MRKTLRTIHIVEKECKWYINKNILIIFSPEKERTEVNLNLENGWQPGENLDYKWQHITPSYVKSYIQERLQGEDIEEE